MKGGLLSAKAFEKHNHIIPCFEVVTAKKDGRTKEVWVFVARDKIVAIQQVGVVGKHHPIKSWRIEVLLHPRHLPCKAIGGIGWRGCQYVNIITFDKHFVGFVHAGQWLLVAIGHCVGVDKHDGALSARLIIVYLAYQRQKIVHGHLVC